MRTLIPAVLRERAALPAAARRLPRGEGGGASAPPHPGGSGGPVRVALARGL